MAGLPLGAGPLRRPAENHTDYTQSKNNYFNPSSLGFPSYLTANSTYLQMPVIYRDALWRT